MGRDTKIYGIVLIKNEDLYIQRVLENSLDFCDEILVLDNYSEDETYGIINDMKRAHPKINLERIENPHRSHNHIAHLAGSDTWLFAIDGDEIYDPVGLAKCRAQVLAGDYDDLWRIFSYSLNLAQINVAEKKGAGCMSPPARPSNKFFNFAILDSWEEPENERLHGTHAVFKTPPKTLNLYDHYSWEEAHMRNIHLCFIRRSSLEQADSARPNPNDVMAGVTEGHSHFKIKNYFRKDDLKVYDISEFFP